MSWQKNAQPVRRLTRRNIPSHITPVSTVMSTLDLRLPVGRLTHFAGFSSRPGLREANRFAGNASACERPVLHEVSHSGTSPVIARPEETRVLQWSFGIISVGTLPGLYGASSCCPFA